MVVLILIPVGNEDAEYINVPYPPLPLTGLNAVNGIVLVNEYVAGATAVANTGGAVTVNVKLPVLVTPPLSLTVTVYSVAALYAVGVPEITPVDALIDSPVGNAGRIL